MNAMKKRIIYYIVIAMVCVAGISSSVYAEDVDFDIAVDDPRLTLGSGTELKLIFTDVGDIPAPEIPDTNEYNVQYVGPSTMMSITNGQMSRSITHVYSFIPRKTGQITIGPFSFTYKGDRYHARAISVTVDDQPIRSNQGVNVGQTSDSTDATLDDYVFLTLDVGKTKAYINEYIPVTIRLFRTRVRVEIEEYPTFNYDGFSIEDFEKPRQYQKTLNGVLYEVVEFKTHIFGTRAGVFALGPASLNCNLLVSQSNRRSRSSFFNDSFFDSFFGRYERRPIELTAPKIDMHVMPLPTEGKPDSFDGAQGDFNFELSASPKEVKVGDPITLRMNISGEGNFTTVKVPKLVSKEGFKTYDPSVQQKENTKVFEQVILPTTDTIEEIPKIVFSYFNTRTGTYETQERGPIPITVEEGEEGQNLTIIDLPPQAGRPQVREVLGKDIVFLKEKPGHMQTKDYMLLRDVRYVGMHVFPLLVYFGMHIYLKRRERLATDTRYARRLRAPRQARKGIKRAANYLAEDKREEFYDAIFKILQEYLGDLLHIPSGGITIDIIKKRLDETSIDKGVINTIAQLFNVCDMVRYAPQEVDTKSMQEAFDALKYVIDQCERARL